MEALSNSLSHHNNLAGLLSKNPQEGSNLQFGVFSRTKARTELEITTAEGDRVTLFSQSKIRTAYTSYDSTGAMKGEGSSGTTDMFRLISTSKVTISVEGDLSDEELADIQHLLQSVENLFMNILTEGGNIDESMMSSISMDSMKTLSSFDAELKYSQKISGFGVVSGDSKQISDSAANQETASAEAAQASEVSGNTAPDLTAMAAFKSRTKASLHLSGARLQMQEPAQTTSPEILPGTGESANITSAPETTVPDPAANPASMISLDSWMKTSVRIKLVEEFASFIHGSAVENSRIAPVLSQFIPTLIERLNDDYLMSENQQNAIQQTGDDILNTFQNISQQ